jgi:entericidin B
MFRDVRLPEQMWKGNPMTYLYILPLLAVMAIAGCETIEGAGRDLGTAGDAISQEAQEAQSEI